MDANCSCSNQIIPDANHLATRVTLTRDTYCRREVPFDPRQALPARRPALWRPHPIASGHYLLRYTVLGWTSTILRHILCRHQSPLRRWIMAHRPEWNPAQGPAEPFLAVNSLQLIVAYLNGCPSLDELHCYQ